MTVDERFRNCIFPLGKYYFKVITTITVKAKSEVFAQE